MLASVVSDCESGWIAKDPRNDIKYISPRQLGVTFRTASNIYTNKITELQRKRTAMVVYAVEGKSEENPPPKWKRQPGK